MKKRFGLSMNARHVVEGYSFISIWIIGFFLFMAIPLGKSFYYAFNNLKITKEGLIPDFVGLDHFRAAFTTDVEFLPRLQGTLLAMLTNVPLIIIFAIFSALLLNRPMVGRTFFRGIFFLPVIIASGAVLGELIEQGATRLPVFQQASLFFALNDFIPVEILEPILLMADALTLVMWDSGVQILIFLAGLQTISPSLYEAAHCDGATKWESFWKITFPMIIPMIFVNILYTIVNSFTNINNEIMQYIRMIVFQRNDYGYGSAMGWIYFILIFLIIALVFYIFRNSINSTDGRR